MDDLDQDQQTFDVMSGTYAVERCAREARVAARQGTRLVGVAPDSLRDLLARELVHVPGDVDYWLGRQGITVTWVASGAPGASADQAGTRTEVRPPLSDLMLWPAAE